MTTPLDLLYHKIGLKLKKLEDQKRFNFLKTLECDYCSTDFSILDPFNLQHHPFVKKEQIRWIEKMGVGSYNSRFQADHIALQNGLSQRLTPQGFFTPCSLEELSHEVRSFLNEKEGDSLVQTFEKDPLGLLLLGFEQHLKAPLIQTSCAPFAQFYLIEEPLHALLFERSPPFLLPPYTLAAIHTALDLLPAMQRERKEILEKTEFLYTALKRLGFDLSIQKFAVHVNTSKKETYIQELKEKGWRVHPSAQGFSIYLRIDHAESILVDLIEDLKKMTVKKTAIAC